MKKLLVVPLLALALAGCDPESDTYKWVGTGTLSGISCGVGYDIANRPIINSCLAVVRSESPIQTNSYKVDKDYQDLLGKQVDVSRVGSDKYRITAIAEPKP